MESSPQLAATVSQSLVMVAESPREKKLTKVSDAAKFGKRELKGCEYVEDVLEHEVRNLYHWRVNHESGACAKGTMHMFPFSFDSEIRRPSWTRLVVDVAAAFAADSLTKGIANRKRKRTTKSFGTNAWRVQILSFHTIHSDAAFATENIEVRSRLFGRCGLSVSLRKLYDPC